MPLVRGSSRIQKKLLMKFCELERVVILKSSRLSSLVKLRLKLWRKSWRPMWFKTSSPDPSRNMVQGKNELNAVPLTLSAARFVPSKVRGSGKNSARSLRSNVELADSSE